VASGSHVVAGIAVVAAEAVHSHLWSSLELGTEWGWTAVVGAPVSPRGPLL
jgi:hypothetical protein